MSELDPEVPVVQVEKPDNQSNSVAIAAIIATAVVVLACIIGCVAISIAFFINAPW